MPAGSTARLYGLAIFITTLAINLMGNALRDWLAVDMEVHMPTRAAAGALAGCRLPLAGLAANMLGDAVRDISIRTCAGV